jgi:NADPH:quinone reductase
MMVVVTNGGGSVSLRDADDPIPAAGQVKVRAACSLVSGGTELHYASAAPFEGEPRRLGYCSAGFVEAVGADVNELEVGAPVIAMGWDYAVHAEAIVVPRRLVVPVVPSLPLEHAVFANLGATALHALHRAGPVADKWLLVLGAGLVGHLVARLAVASGARVILVDAVDERLRCTPRAIHALPLLGGGAVSRSVRELTRGHGIDTIMLCTSGPGGFPTELCLEWLARGPDGNRRGTIVAVGRFPLQIGLAAEIGNIDIRVASRCGTGYRDDAYVHGRTSYPAPLGEATVDANLQTCLAWIEQGRLSVAELISHRIEVARAPQAYELLRDAKRTMGIIFTYARNYRS